MHGGEEQFQASGGNGERGGEREQIREHQVVLMFGFGIQ